ncbi:MAG: hypothetical protein IKO72_12220 [Kiritimatiellae bacterium]|nr:hypothetical protein [Kiritimatiellia bacterium]
MNRRPFLCFAAAVVLAGLSCQAADFKHPKMRNAGFESGLEEWAAPGPGWRLVSGEGRGGSAALAYEGGVSAGPLQRLAVGSGTKYRFGAWVKIIGRDGEKPAPRIVFRWFSWQDKQLGEAKAEAVVDNNPDDTGGWVRYECLTPAIHGPYADIFAEVPEGTKSRVLFDDFNFFAEGGMPVGRLISSAYRDEAASGKIGFAVQLNINTVLNPLSGLKARFIFEGEGGTFTLKPCALAEDKAIVRVDVAKLRKGASKVRFELDAADGKQLGCAEIGFTRRDSLPRRRVSIDEYNRTIVDGRLFFPLGMFAGGLSAEEIAVYREGPFNCILCYSPSKKAMDLCRDAGIMFIDNVKDYVAGSRWAIKGCETKEKSHEMLRRHIEEVASHPALLAWYTNDEAPESLLPALYDFNELIHSLDPDHPTYTVLDRPEHVRTFSHTFDVIGMDPYPIGNNRGGVDIAYGWAAVAHDAMYAFRPMWHVPQAYNWYWHEARRKIAAGDPDLRFPTREEFRSMLWQPIAAGANGLIPYAFHEIRRHEKGAVRDAIWKMVCEEMTVVKANFGVLLSKPGPAVKGSSADLVVRTYKGEDGVWLLACNTSRRPVKARLEVAGGADGASCAMGGGVRRAPDGSLAVDMPPMGVALAKVK